MKLTSWSLLTLFLCAIAQEIQGKFSFAEDNILCPKEGSTLAKLQFPKAYSTNIRLNYLEKYSTTEIKRIVDEDSKKEVIEFRSDNRHVKYIIRGDKKVVLAIYYPTDEHPKCTVKRSLNPMEYLDKEDRGPDDIIPVIDKLLHNGNFSASYIAHDNAIYAAMWNGCFKDPEIIMAVLFSDENWVHPDKSFLSNYTQYPVQILATIPKSITLSALYSNFNPTIPDFTEFQPPEDVYCSGFQAEKPPEIYDYFSFNSEIVVYESAEGIAPIVTHRKVFYDKLSNISRTDFHDALAEDSDTFSQVTAKFKSVIQDFNSGVQYTLHPDTGNCSVKKLETIFTVISEDGKVTNEMPGSKKYFLMDGSKISYNGKFSTRGLTAKVYTSSIPDTNDKKKKNIISWYFSTESTQIVENEKVEKNILLRMNVRPEAGMDKEGVVEINFYDFAEEEPDVFAYDLTSCYNEKSLKYLVLTFPGKDKLKGSGNLIRMLVHSAIMELTGISKQRIVVKDVTFSGGYMYVEFTLLDKPSTISNEYVSTELSLQEVTEKLQTKVSSGTFSVTVPIDNNGIVLRAEPDGLNVFSGDRRKPSATGYKEGSVVAMTVGMLFLGFLLGLVTLNLIISRKFGVSLFQKAKYGDAPFSNQLGESSM